MLKNNVKQNKIWQNSIKRKSQKKKTKWKWKWYKIMNKLKKNWRMDCCLSCAWNAGMLISKWNITQHISCGFIISGKIAGAHTIRVELHLSGQRAFHSVKKRSIGVGDGMYGDATYLTSTMWVCRADRFTRWTNRRIWKSSGRMSCWYGRRW